MREMSEKKRKRKTRLKTGNEGAHHGTLPGACVIKHLMVANNFA